MTVDRMLLIYRRLCLKCKQFNCAPAVAGGGCALVNKGGK